MRKMIIKYKGSPVDLQDYLQKALSELTMPEYEDPFIDQLTLESDEMVQHILDNLVSEVQSVLQGGITNG